MWTFFKPGLLNVHTDEHTQDVTCIKISKDGRTAISGMSEVCFDSSIGRMSLV